VLAEPLQAAIIAGMNLTLQKRPIALAGEASRGSFWFGFYYFVEK